MSFPGRDHAPLRCCMRALLLLLCCVALRSHAVELADDRGITVSVPQPPRRIVSVLPSLTESVCALGGCERLVGVDRYSDYPASVRSLPKVGGGLDPSVEAIVALRPDIVLMATSSRATERLESLGIKVVALEPRSAADVQRVLGRIGTLLDLPGAPRIWHAIDDGIAAAARSVPPRARGARVYFEVNAGPYAAGASSFMGETLTRLGMRNVIGPELGPFPKINPEFVVRADPDLIMVSERTGQAMEQRPGWADMRAVRQHRVCRFTAEQSNVLARPGPRMAEAAWIMARCIAEKAT